MEEENIDKADDDDVDAEQIVEFESDSDSSSYNDA